MAKRPDDAMAFEFAVPARRITRWLAKKDPRRFCAPQTPPDAKGRHLSKDELVYMFLLATDHLTRHNMAGKADACPNENKPCPARGAAYALLEIVHYADDAGGVHAAHARTVHRVLADLRRSMEAAQVGIQGYLIHAKKRHQDARDWGRPRSHDHRNTCHRPGLLFRAMLAWQRVIATVEAETVMPQFRSDTARGKLFEGRRPSLRASVEAILREDGWLLHEILLEVDEVSKNDLDYPERFESIKKRLAGVRPRAQPPGAAAEAVAATHAPTQSQAIADAANKTPRT